MESVYLKTLLEVVRTGSFTKAADNLSITQSAVSRRIKFMEVQYGYQLLDRSSAIPTPTEHGRMVLEKASVILDLEQELLSSLKQSKSRMMLTFVCTPTFGMVYFPKILRNFVLSQTNITDMNFVLENPDEILRGLKDGQYEMAVIEHCEDYDLGDFETIALPDDEVIIAAAPHLELGDQPDIMNHLFKQVLYVRGDGCCLRKLLEKNLTGTGRRIDEFQRILTVDDLNIIIDALVNGDGIAFISRDLIQGQIDEGQIITVRLPGFIHLRKRTLVFSDHLPRGSNGEVFINYILAHFGMRQKGSLANSGS